jgi:hypothetical protein
MHQFGPDHTRARKFRERFNDVLTEMRKVYDGARKITEYEEGGRPGGLMKQCFPAEFRPPLVDLTTPELC